MTVKKWKARRALVLVGFGIAAALCGCEKTQKTSTAGGGASTQSVMTIRGAGQ